MKEIYKQTSIINATDPVPSFLHRSSKFSEEVGEFIQTVNMYAGRKKIKPGLDKRQELVEEAADVIGTLFSTLLAVETEKPVTYDELVEAVKKKRLKWKKQIAERNKNKTIKKRETR